MKSLQRNSRRSLGSFETMEDRKLFAADLLGAAELVDTGVAWEADIRESTDAGIGIRRLWKTESRR